MKIVENNKVTVYRYDGQYGASYSIGISKKLQDGKYENGYMPVRFKKDTELENKTQIYIKDAWLSFNLKDKKTYPFIFINEFITLDEAIEPSKKAANDPYKDFANEKQEEINDLDFQLPF